MKRNYDQLPNNKENRFVKQELTVVQMGLEDFLWKIEWKNQVFNKCEEEVQCWDFFHEQGWGET